MTDELDEVGKASARLLDAIHALKSTDIVSQREFAVIVSAMRFVGMDKVADAVENLASRYSPIIDAVLHENMRRVEEELKRTQVNTAEMLKIILDSRDEPHDALTSVDEVNPKQIEIPTWYRVDGRAVRRGSLEPSHPESTYGFVKRLGIDPADYGISSTEPHDVLFDGSAKILFGLEAQGHVPKIEAMLRDGRDWPFIGRAIGWDGDTARQYYERYLKERRP